jgi:hypothetical protein
MAGGRLKPSELKKRAADALGADDIPSSSSDSSLPLPRAARPPTMAAPLPAASPLPDAPTPVAEVAPTAPIAAVALAAAHQSAVAAIAPAEVTPAAPAAPKVHAVSRRSPFGALLSRTLPRYGGPHAVGVCDVETPVTPRTFGKFVHKAVPDSQSGLALDTVLLTLFYPAERQDKVNPVVWFPACVCALAVGE